MNRHYVSLIIGILFSAAIFVGLISIHKYASKDFMTTRNTDNKNNHEAPTRSEHDPTESMPNRTSKKNESSAMPESIIIQQPKLTYALPSAKAVNFPPEHTKAGSKN